MASRKKLQSLVSEIRTFCLEHADEKQVEKYARFFTEGYDAYGVRKEIFFEEKDRFIEAHLKKFSINDLLTLGGMLLQSGKYEEASFAILFLKSYQDELTPATFQALGGWLEKGICNWGHTDVLCGEILFKFFENEIVQLKDMSSWRESESKWKRRAVPVTAICLIKTLKKVKPLLNFFEPMMMDDDRFVQQGLGWFLREVWKKHPKPVETLLLKWKDSAPRKIYQYATEKMTKEEKARFRRERKK